MPEVAANTTEAVVLSWPVAVNVPFAARDTIVTVETAKAVVDVEAETDGVILRTLVAEGTETAVGEPIALIARTGEVVPDVDAALLTLGQPADAKGLTALEIPEAEPAPATPAPSQGAFHPPVPAESDRPAGARVFSSPLARRLARDADLAIETLVGTGPNDRIIRRDVEAAIQLQQTPEAVRGGSNGVASAPATTAAAAKPVTAPAKRNIAAATYTDVPITRQRRMIAARLTSSKQTTPHFYLRGTARVDALLALRAELNDDAVTRVSVNDLLVKAVAMCHVRVPAMNVTFEDSAIRHYDSVDVSVAVAATTGLVTPIVRSAEARTVTDIGSTIKEFVSQANSGRLRQQDLEGGSITVTNLGMYGVEEFAAIINPPQAAILAVGGARQEPLVLSGELTVATIIHLTLSVDHRAVDGAQAAQWMAALVALVEHPVRILA